MNSGANHTLAETMLRYIEGSNEEVMLIDDVKYPNNKPCAHYNETIPFEVKDVELLLLGDNPIYG